MAIRLLDYGTGGNNWASGLSLCSESCTVTKGCVWAAVWKLHGQLAFCSLADRTGPDRHQHVLCTFPPRIWLPLYTTVGQSGPVLLSPVILQSFIFRLVAAFQFLCLSDTLYPVDMVRQVFCMYHSVDTACSLQWLPTFHCTRLCTYAQSWSSSSKWYYNVFVNPQTSFLFWPFISCDRRPANTSICCIIS